MHNHGNFIVSLGALCAWLAPQAEALGVEIYPGFAAAEPLFDEDGAVGGVRIGDMGVAKDGSHKPGYTQGIDIKAPLTVLAEGCRGHLTKQLIRALQARRGQRSADATRIGIKELWQLPAGTREAGQGRAHARLAARSPRPTAAASSITSTRIASRSASSPGSTTRIRRSRRSKRSSS